VQINSWEQLDELAHRLDDLLAGRADAELAELVLLADGFTSVLLREVDHARAASGPDRPG
jgi:hypothetical protein